LPSNQLTLSERLRLWRLHLGLAQAEVERRAGLAHNALSRIETGSVVPRLETLERIAAALDLSIEQLQFRLPPEPALLGESTASNRDVQQLNDLIARLPTARREKLVALLTSMVEEVLQ
jgi:transcriptional regulator with XRE-family HTH domain